jgi:hypothetical protein
MRGRAGEGAAAEARRWRDGDAAHARRKAQESALRVPVVSLAARFGGVVELEPPLGPF